MRVRTGGWGLSVEVGLRVRCEGLTGTKEEGLWWGLEGWSGAVQDRRRRGAMAASGQAVGK
jgi:hypothetical protein